MHDYCVNTDNSFLKSEKRFSSFIECMVRMIEKGIPDCTPATTVALNAAYFDRERLSKAGHNMEDDAAKTLAAANRNFGLVNLTTKILIPLELSDEEREKYDRLRAEFLAKKQARAGATAPPEPVPEPEPVAEPINVEPPEPAQQAEPVKPQPQPTAKHPTYKIPTTPGYIIPEEYGLIHYNLSNNIDVCIEGDASAGKSLTLEVMCEAEGWNLVQIGKVIDDTMLKGFMNPITKEFTPSKLIRALKHDPEICPIEGAKTVIAFDEGFTNMADYLTTLLPLVGRRDGGYLATEDEVIMRDDVVFVFIDNSTGDGGTTNYISRKPIDMALKSRLFYIHMKLSPKIAKAICKDDKDLLNFTKWMRSAVSKGKVDRLSLDNRGLNMIQEMKDWEGFSDDMLGEILYGSFFKGCPPASLATLLRNVSAKPEELQANKYFVATQNYYLKLCKACGLSSDPQAVKS